MSDIRLLSQAEFPTLLKEITDPPEKLYIEGELPSPESKFLCVVGSRKYSPYGKDICTSLIQGLAGQPIVIVSGLALGIDAVAHQAALDAGLKTIAVPGSGLGRQVLYPSTNRHLADEIVTKGGALISEYEPTFRATTWTFPKRNRLMAGMSHAVLVIEAENKSGTLITARLAMEYNRDVLAVPGSIHSSTSDGPHNLIRDGAALIRNSDDILEALGLSVESKEAISYNDCTPEEQHLISFLSSPRPKEELFSLLEMPVSEANIILSALEIKGIITETMGEIRLR